MNTISDISSISPLAFQSPADIRFYQENQLRQLLQYLASNSPYYQRLFKSNAIDIHAIKTITDLAMIPCTRKEALQQHNWDFLCVARNKVVEYCTTSGTTGNPVTIALTAKDLERLAYNEFLSFRCAGGNSEDVYQLMLSLDRQFMAGIAYYLGIRRLGGGVARVGPGNILQQIETMRQIKSTVLVAVPSFIVQLIKVAEAQSIDLNATGIRKIICIGENIREEQGNLNLLGDRIASSWNVALHSTYASTEMQTAFTECEHGKGGHHQPELLIFEILDEQDKPLGPGEYGEMTITTLGVEGMPLLRYKTGDICTYYVTQCACGRNSYRMSPVQGRKQQRIKYKGTTLYPVAIFNVLNGIAEIADYAVELFTSELGVDDLLISVCLQKGNENTHDKIRKLMQSSIRIIPEIRIVTQQEIIAIQAQHQGRKASKLIDRRHGSTF